MNSPTSTTNTTGRNVVDDTSHDDTKPAVTLLEHQDTPSTTSVEEVTDNELHRDVPAAAAATDVTATTTTTTTTEETIIKLQSFVRGSLTRARVSIMVGQLIEELLASQQQQQQQQQNQQQQSDDGDLEQTEKVEHEKAVVPTENGTETGTETVRDDDTVVVTNVSTPTSTTATGSAKPEEAASATPKAVKKTYAFPTAEVATASFATSPRAKSHKHQASSPVTLKPHYFPSGRQQQFVPFNTPAEWPPKDGLVVPPAVEYSSSPSKSTKPPVPPLSFVPPISESSPTKQTEMKSGKALGGTAPKVSSTNTTMAAVVAAGVKSSQQEKEDGPPKRESLRERMKRYQAADKTPMGQQQQFGGGALKSTPAYYGTSYTKAKASTSSPSKPPVKAAADSPPPPPPPPVKHEPEPSPADVVASAPSIAARSQVFGTMASSPRSTMTATKKETTTAPPAAEAVVVTTSLAEEPEKTISIADRKKGFFKAAYSPKNKAKKAVEIPAEPSSTSPSATLSAEPKKNVLNRYAPVVTSPSSGGGPSSLKQSVAEEKIQKVPSKTAADSVGSSSHHSVLDRYHPEKRPAAAAATTASGTSSVSNTTQKPQPEKSTAQKGSVMSRYPVAGNVASSAPSPTKPFAAGNPDKKPYPSVMDRYSPAVVSKEVPTKPHVKIDVPSTDASKRSVMDRYHPESNHQNNNSSRSLGNSSNHSLGSVPGKAKTGHDFASSWHSKSSQSSKQMMSPKRESVDVDDPAWQAQLSESGVFTGWEHAQETAQQAGT